MQRLVLNIEDNRYQLLLQFLKTLDYVRIVPNNPNEPEKNATVPPSPTNQLLLIKQQLEDLPAPLFQTITDPVAWQKQQRDEWA